MSITRFILGSALLAPLTLACVACGGSENTEPTGDATAQGSISGGTAPAGSKVLVAWSVSSGSPDYVFKFGEGTVKGGTFVVGALDEPPAEAINSYGLGIGFLVLVDGKVSLPDGKFDEDDLGELFGMSARHAIIWRAETAKDGRTWGSDFPAGYSCGVCVPAPEGETFDSYAPVDCSKMVIDMSSERDVCNWT
jgi:hypothetical protein